MLRIMLPCSPFDERELNARVKILKDYVGDKYPIGLELVGEWDEFFDKRAIKTAKMNLEKTCKTMYLSMHAPINKKEKKKNFFNQGYKGSLKDFSQILGVAEEFGVSLVNFHASAIYSFKDIFKKKVDFDELANQQVKKVAGDLSNLDFKGTLCVENITGYCDIENLEIRNMRDFKNVFFEAGFIDPKDILVLHQMQQKAFATIDICHLSTICDSTEIVEKMKEVAPIIRHIHFNDGFTAWRPLFPKFAGGLVPGDGEIGEKGFKEEIVPFIRNLSMKQDVNIMIEVLREDFIESKNSKESLRRLLSWLG